MTIWPPHKLLRDLLRQWLGISAHDTALNAQRTDIDALRVDLDKDAAELGANGINLTATMRQLNRTTAAGNDVQARLSYYENTVPGIAGAHRSLKARIAKQTKARAAEEALARVPVLADGPPNEPAIEDELPEMGVVVPS